MHLKINLLILLNILFVCKLRSFFNKIIIQGGKNLLLNQIVLVIYILKHKRKES